jgi:hypothetical protein
VENPLEFSIVDVRNMQSFMDNVDFQPEGGGRTHSKILETFVTTTYFQRGGVIVKN